VSADSVVAGAWGERNRNAQATEEFADRR